MRIRQGTTDKYIYFVAVDPTDLKTRETGLTSFTVYYEIDNGTATAMTTPTTTEADATNMPGVYTLLIDESGMTTLTAGDTTAELCLHITHASMEPVTRVIEIYREDVTAGNTLDVTATGEAGLDLANVAGVLGQANVGWVDANSRVDVGSWLGTAVTLGAGAPDVNVQSMDTDSISAAALSAAAVDEIWDEVITEPSQGVPAATPSFRTIISWWWMDWRNKLTQSATEFAVYNDAGTQLAKATLSDAAGVVTKAEFVSGA